MPTVTATATPKQELNKLERDIARGVARDQRIFKFLAAGPASIDHIHRDIFKKENGELTHINMAERRLKTLTSMRYLKQRVYKRTTARRGIKVFALDEAGVNEACNNNAIHRDHIRDGFPSEAQLMHEMIVSQAIRTIWREVEEKKYGISYIYDDRQMKRQFRAQKKRTRYYFPDLRVLLLPPYRDQMVFNIELDAGTKGANYWKPKIASWSDPSLILTLNKTRQAFLMDYVIDSQRKNITGFALASDFLRHGMTGTIWTWLPGKTAAKLDIK